MGILHPPNCNKPHHLAKVLILGWNTAFLEAPFSPPVTPLVSLKLKLRKEFVGLLIASDSLNNISLTKIV